MRPVRLLQVAAAAVLVAGTVATDPGPADAAPLPDYPTERPPVLYEQTWPEPDWTGIADTYSREVTAGWEAYDRAEWLRIEAERNEAEARAVTRPPAPSSGWVHAWITDTILAALRQCESTGRYDAATGNGFRGAVQWLQPTWDAAAVRADRPDLVGVRPNEASPGDQDYLTKVWWSVSDYRGQWPVCGPQAVRRAG